MKRTASVAHAARPAQPARPAPKTKAIRLSQPLRPEFKVALLSQLNYQKAVEGLGKICVEFQRLESHVKAAIGLLLDPDDHRLGTIVTAKLSFRASLDLFCALYRHRFNDPLEAKELDAFHGKCVAAEERRNQIIHSHWQPDFEGGKGATRTKHTARKEFKIQQETLTEASMDEITEKLRVLCMEFAKWVPRVGRFRGYPRALGLGRF